MLALAALSLAVPALTAAPPLDPGAPPDAWKAPTVVLAWDVQHRRAASQPATARIATDGANLFVRFDVPQREPVMAQQRTNDVGDGTDDEVQIDLWPNGSAGFFYQFAATPNGTHYQYSTENTAYAPTWHSAGAITAGGYVVTLRIPLGAMRSAGSRTAWKMQLVRIVRSTGERQIWSFDAAQINADDVTYAGSLSSLAAAASVYPKPRLAVYGLGMAGSPSSGLTTSRTGADVSVPITATSSFFATVHPDFSNVEVDQQSIAPTVFARRLTEVRPFFTQAANYLNPFYCAICPFVKEIYTPAIPTPRSGYAVEGKQGPFSFAAFDAVGAGRDDAVAAVSYTTADNRLQIAAQDVAADRSGVHDRAVTTGLWYRDNRHIAASLNYGSDANPRAPAANGAQRYDANVYWSSSTFGAAVSARKIGGGYRPADGFVTQPDIAGYAAYVNKIWVFDRKTILSSVQAGTDLTRYHDHTGALDSADSKGWVDLVTRNLIDLEWTFGSSYVRTADGVFTPVSQSGVQLTWHSGADYYPGCSGCHATTATPTVLGYSTGRFGPGRVDSWIRSSTIRAGSRGTVSLELDDTRDALDAGALNVQWLERAGYTFAAGPNTAFALGVRRIIGTGPAVTSSSPPAYVNASNVAFSYHRRLPHDELFFAYGDASRLSTVPAFIVKLIHYFGAEKGT